MQTPISSTIKAIGAYTPEQIINNQLLESTLDTNNEWIMRKTGVVERRRASKDQFSSQLAIRAVEDLVNTNVCSLDDVDMIIVTTFAPDHLAPHVAALVHGHFKMGRAGTMDISAGCTGFMYGLQVADSFICSRQFRKILLISSETMSKVMDHNDRNSSVLFGDAAVALLVEADEARPGKKTSWFDSDGQAAANIYCSNLSDRIFNEIIEQPRTFTQQGRQVYDYVVKNIPAGIRNLLRKAELNMSDIDWFVPHSANVRMIEALCAAIDFPFERTVISNQYYGNTSSASIPLSLWLGNKKSLFKHGDRILLYGFGAGFTQGGIILEW